MTRQAGEGKMGCLVTLALLVAFGFVCLRTIPVLIDKMDFEDQLERIASEGGARSLDAEVVRNQVEDLAKNKEFNLSPESLQIRQSGTRGGDLRIRVKYWRDVNFAGYVYTFRFETEAKSFIGTL